MSHCIFEQPASLRSSSRPPPVRCVSARRGARRGVTPRLQHLQPAQPSSRHCSTEPFSELLPNKMQNSSGVAVTFSGWPCPSNRSWASGPRSPPDEFSCSTCARQHHAQQRTLVEWLGCVGSLDAEELGERKVRRDLLAVVEADAARVQPILTLVAADHPLAVIVTSATDALDRRVIFGRDLLRVDAVADRLVYHRLAAFRTAKRGARSRRCRRRV